jgi:hypothetical protein
MTYMQSPAIQGPSSFSFSRGSNQISHFAKIEYKVFLYDTITDLPNRNLNHEIDACDVNLIRVPKMAKKLVILDDSLVKTFNSISYLSFSSFGKFGF